MAHPAAKLLARLGWVLLCLPGLAGAQQGFMLEPSDTPNCLTPGPEARADMVYPPDLLARKIGGTVNARLTFAFPDRGPSVRFTSPTGSVDRALESAVAEHVRQFRMPCMAPDGPLVRLDIDFVFTPNDGRPVATSAPSDPAERERQALVQCIVHRGGEQRPEYPAAERREGTQGNYLVRLRFVAPDQPPVMHLLAGAPSRMLRTAVQRHVAGLRMPCLGAEPVDVSQFYRFRMEDGSRTLLRDLPLKDLVGAASDFPVPVLLDLNAMGCPFSLRFTYYRPHLRNIVQQLVPADPARQPLLDWLSRLTLRLPEPTANAVLGDTMTVDVPCGRVNIADATPR